MRDLQGRPAVVRVGAALMLAVLLAGLAVVATGGSDKGREVAARVVTEGRARIEREGDDPREVTGAVNAFAGDVVEALTGVVRIELPTGSVLEGRAGGDDRDATRVRIGGRGEAPELVVGDLLVTSTPGAVVDVGGTRVTLDRALDQPAAARLSRSLAVGAGAYRGALTVDSAGQVRRIPALRELEIPVLGRPPAEPRPLRVDEADPWDRRFLGEAIDVGKQLDADSRAYTASLRAGEGRSVGFLQLVLPALGGQPDFTAELLAASPQREPGETLVGAAIAVLGRRGTFVERWTSTFAFRDDGADWGLVALDQGVTGDPLTSTVEQALNATPFPFAEAAQRASTSTDVPVQVVPSIDPGTTATTTGPAPTTPGPTTPPPSTPPPTSQPSPPTVDIVPPTGVPIVDQLVGTVEQLLGGLLGPAPPPGG